MASLRARGIGEHVDLPQLVVCGDQSAGKSSVLEGITGIPFPRQDGVCTKFATEIILEHTDDEQTVTATILPVSARDEKQTAALRSFRRDLESLDELPIVIADAGELMGVRGFGKIKEGPAFTQDVLRIRVSGRTGLHLTVVDLPGLISVPTEEQTQDDLRTVHDLVNSYLEKSRTIILAVVQASNDIANQAIIQKAKSFDVAGERTIGIITKPDLINKGTEKRIALLAKNQDTTKLKLGFCIVKNASPTEMSCSLSAEARNERERYFFQSPPWKEQSLDRNRVGIVALRGFMQSLLDQHIDKELPKVREEIRKLVRKTEEDVLVLGDERPTIAHIRMFVSRLAMRFYNLTTAGLNGDYLGGDTQFFDVDSEGSRRFIRLRAFVHRTNTIFSDELRDAGKKINTEDPRRGDDSDDSYDDDAPDQIRMTQGEMRDWVKTVRYSFSD